MADSMQYLADFDVEKITSANPSQFKQKTVTSFQPEFVILALSSEFGVEWREFSLPLQVGSVEDWSGLSEFWFYQINGLDCRTMNEKKNKLFSVRKEYSVDDSARLSSFSLHPSFAYLICGYVEEELIQNDKKSTIPETKIQYINQYALENNHPTNLRQHFIAEKHKNHKYRERFAKIFGDVKIFDNLFITYLKDYQYDFEKAIRLFLAENSQRGNQNCDNDAKLHESYKKSSFKNSNPFFWDTLDAQLFHAICTSNEKKLKYMLEDCKDLRIDFDVKDSFRRNILHYAGIFGKITMLRMLLKVPKIKLLINSQDKDGYTPLHYAAWFSKGMGIKVHEFVANGASVDNLDNEGMIPSQFAFLSDEAASAFRYLHKFGQNNKQLDVSCREFPHKNNFFHATGIFYCPKNFKHVMENCSNFDFLRIIVGKQNGSGKTPFQIALEGCVEFEEDEKNSKSDQNKTEPAKEQNGEENGEKMSPTYLVDILFNYFSKEELRIKEIFGKFISEGNIAMATRLLKYLTNSGVPNATDGLNIDDLDNLIAPVLPNQIPSNYSSITPKKILEICETLGEDFGATLINENPSFFEIGAKNKLGINCQEFLTLLQEAVLKGWTRIVKILVVEKQEQGKIINLNYYSSAIPKDVEIEAKLVFDNFTAFPPLHLLAYSTEIEEDSTISIIDSLLSRKDLNIKQKMGIFQRNFIHQFIIEQTDSEDAAKILKYFIEQAKTNFGDDLKEIIDESDAIGLTPLAYACNLGKTNFIYLLKCLNMTSISSGLSVNVAKKDIFSISAINHLINSIHSLFYIDDTNSQVKLPAFDLENPASTVFQELTEFHKRYKFGVLNQRYVSIVAPKSTEEGIKIIKRIFEIKSKVPKIMESFMHVIAGITIFKNDIIIIHHCAELDFSTFTKFEELIPQHNQQTPSTKSESEKNFNTAKTFWRILRVSFVLAWLHSLGVIHGNICLKSLLFSEQAAIVSGFGLNFDFNPANERDRLIFVQNTSDKDQSSRPKKIYNLDQFAPEVREQGPNSWHIASDIFAFAKLACSMLLGKQYISSQDAISTLASCSIPNSDVRLKIIYHLQDSLKITPDLRPESMNLVFKNLANIFYDYCAKVPNEDFGYLSTNSPVVQKMLQYAREMALEPPYKKIVVNILLKMKYLSEVCFDQNTRFSEQKDQNFNTEPIIEKYSLEKIQHAKIDRICAGIQKLNVGNSMSFVKLQTNLTKIKERIEICTNKQQEIENSFDWSEIVHNLAKIFEDFTTTLSENQSTLFMLLDLIIICVFYDPYFRDYVLVKNTKLLNYIILQTLEVWSQPPQKPAQDSSKPQDFNPNFLNSLNLLAYLFLFSDGFEYLTQSSTMKSELKEKQKNYHEKLAILMLKKLQNREYIPDRKELPEIAHSPTAILIKLFFYGMQSENKSVKKAAINLGCNLTKFLQEVLLQELKDEDIASESIADAIMKYIKDSLKKHENDTIEQIWKNAEAPFYNKAVLLLIRMCVYEKINLKNHQITSSDLSRISSEFGQFLGKIADVQSESEFMKNSQNL